MGNDTLRVYPVAKETILKVQVVEREPGRGALIRPGELLARSPEAAARWTQSAEPGDGFHVLRLAPGVDPCLLAAELTGCAVHELSPALVKKVVAGHGQAGEAAQQHGERDHQRQLDRLADDSDDKGFRHRRLRRSRG